MADPQHRTVQILSQLEGVDQLSPSDEIATFEQVLSALTELLNAPEEQGPGVG
ncbi:hypothetical protein [Yaniella halotolerans]|uniref:hypothetical protein n=1 Tax=Yaniella halotolerans TaxID=225453 RepID=UPI0003B6611D|nr:hypothetical protein [Yaniella halotolerans]